MKLILMTSVLVSIIKSLEIRLNDKYLRELNKVLQSAITPQLIGVSLK